PLIDCSEGPPCHWGRNGAVPGNRNQTEAPHAAILETGSPVQHRYLGPLVVPGGAADGGLHHHPGRFARSASVHADARPGAVWLRRAARAGTCPGGTAFRDRYTRYYPLPDRRCSSVGADARAAE